MNTRSPLVAGTLGCLCLAGCEQAFEPIHIPGDLSFSVYGYLDATADTQWLRVSAIRESIHTDPNGIDAAVTIEHLETGATVVLHDSVFRYPLELGAELNAVNFWTGEPVEPASVYLLEVTRPDGRIASASVHVPDLIPMPVTVQIRPAPTDLVRVDGMEHLAMVNVLSHVPRECVVSLTVWTEDQPKLGVRVENGTHVIPIRANGLPFECEHPVTKQEIHLVSSGAEWPYDPLAGLEELGHVDVISNVTGGVGFVGGVTTLTIPYEACRYVPFVPGRVCEIVYGPESASIRGTVRDYFCDGRPIIEHRSIITLTELETGKMRPAAADEDGFYEIHGLTPDVLHELEARIIAGGDPPPWDGHYRPYVDTLSFEVGEQVALDIPMRHRRDQCWDGNPFVRMTRP